MGGKKLTEKRKGRNIQIHMNLTHLARDFYEGSTIESQPGAEIIENSQNNENKQTIKILLIISTIL